MKIYLWFCAVHFGLGFLASLKDKDKRRGVVKFVNGFYFAFFCGAIYNLWSL